MADNSEHRLPDVRRIVTGHSQDGKAIVTMDGPPPRIDVRDSGLISTLIWTTDETPAEVWSDEDYGARENNIQPPPNGSAFRVVDFPPNCPGFMHRTDTVDIAICMQGEIDMELDDGVTVHMAANDILVQNGTIHSWLNRGTETCRIAFALLDAKSPGDDLSGPGPQSLEPVAPLPPGKEPILPPIRRIVTTHDAEGKAVIMHDGLAPQRVWREPRGNISTLIWGTDEVPAEIRSAEDFGLRENEIEPPQAGSWARVIDYPPKMTGRMHRTESVDYAVCLAGEMLMELDDGATVTMKAGDVLVQQATIHSWINQGDEPARIVFVLIGSKIAKE